MRSGNGLAGRALEVPDLLNLILSKRNANECFLEGGGFITLELVKFT